MAYETNKVKMVFKNCLKLYMAQLDISYELYKFRWLRSFKLFFSGRVLCFFFFCLTECFELVICRATNREIKKVICKYFKIPPHHKTCPAMEEFVGFTYKLTWYQEGLLVSLATMLLDTSCS